MRRGHSQLATTLCCAIALLLSSSAIAAELDTTAIIARLGPGSGPQWSPSGRLISLYDKEYLQVVRSDGTGRRFRIVRSEQFATMKHIWETDTTIVVAIMEDRDSEYVLFARVAFDALSNDAHDSTSTVADIQRIGAMTFPSSGRRQLPQLIRFPDGTVAYRKGAHAEPTDRSRGTLSTAIRNLPVAQIIKDTCFPYGGYVGLGRIGDAAAALRQITFDNCYFTVTMSPTYDRFAADWYGGVGFAIYDTTGALLNGQFETESEKPSSGGAEYAYQVAWSPDGRHLAVVRAVEDGHDVTSWRIIITDVAESTRREVVRQSDNLPTLPMWSPDGRLIAMSLAGNGIVIIRVLPL